MIEFSCGGIGPDVTGDHPDGPSLGDQFPDAYVGKSRIAGNDDKVFYTCFQ